MEIIKQKLVDEKFDLSDAWVTAYLKDQNKTLGAEIDFPAVIVCPGGGYTKISDRETEIIALNFLSQGYHAFVLNYSLLPSKESLYPKLLIELAKTFEWIEQYQKQYHIDMTQITMAGFSAGGHLTALYTGMKNEWIRKYTQARVIKPFRQLLAYPLINFEYTPYFKEKEMQNILGDFTDGAADKLVTAETPSTFIWTTQTDEIVPVKNSLRYIEALAANKVDYEAHIFGWGPHGLSMSNEQTNYPPSDERHSDRNYLNRHASKWFELAMEWLRREEFDNK